MNAADMQGLGLFPTTSASFRLTQLQAAAVLSRAGREGPSSPLS